MNAIFSAQADRIPIDACLLGAHESSFLQQARPRHISSWVASPPSLRRLTPEQASNLTGGICLRPARPDALLQYLLSVFAVDLFSRRFLTSPMASGVDSRAACFCHKARCSQGAVKGAVKTSCRLSLLNLLQATIDMGYVCSVCMSIYCAPQQQCHTCGTEFEVGASG